MSSLSRQIAKEIRNAKLKEDMAGQGIYIYENNTKGDLFLPRPTSSGRRFVRKGEQFSGDNYYFAMLRTNELKLIREVAPPPDTTKLLTEQPPVVTNEGTVEVIAKKPCNEQQRPPTDVLLTESPVGGIKVIR